LLAWLLLLPGTSTPEPLDAIINPKAAWNAWVSDMAAVIDEDTERRLNAVIDQLEQKTTAEIAVVTIRRTDGRTPKEFATALFQHWGIGKQDKDNGVLVLLVLEARRIEVETGYGVEGVLPDGKVGAILDTLILPRFKQGDFGGGLLAGVEAMGKVLAAAAETMPPVRSRPARDSVVSQALRTVTSPLVVVPVLLGAVLLLALVGFSVRRSRIRYCPQCRRQLRRLREDQDNAYLSGAQQCEEELGSVDYRVWRCDECQLCTMERALRWFSRYEECPECGHRTVYEESHTLQEPTYVQDGVREVRRTCRFPSCSYRQIKRYEIPHKVALSSAGGGGWSSGGGGGWSSGSSGSFGGGSSGGGGAGRSW
jgi:uncharacterized protein